MTELAVRDTTPVAPPTPRPSTTGEAIPPRVVAGEVVFSWPRPVPWAVTDPTQILAIALRIEHYRKPWWKRMGTLPPVPGTATRTQLDRATRHLPLNLTIGRP